MSEKKTTSLDYTDEAILEEILVRQRRDMWTPEQIASLSKHFRLAPGMAMLDAGCGHGYSLRTFGPRCLPGGRLVGVDREAHLLERAAQLADAEGLGGAATFVTGDLHELPFDDNTFDVVMVQVVLCHIAEPQVVLDELIRVTRSGGCVAVFDNAVAGGEWGWTNIERETTDERTTRCREDLLAHEGRRMLGRGDWSVGLHMPMWMEARGMHDVDARINERVSWMAPPYRSASQQNAVRHARERSEDNGFMQSHLVRFAEEMRAAGADDAAIENAVRASRERDEQFHAAFTEGAAAFAYGGTFWCIWGFKP